MDETLMSPPNKRSAVWGLTNYLPGRELGKFFYIFIYFLILLLDYTTYYKIIKKY